MATGLVESWAGRILDIGPIYPFVGSETFLFILGLIFWVGWHIWQTRIETKEFEEDLARIKRAGGVSRALDQDQS
jgi:hypothetical protein